jgi:aspartate/methionine/tyrosine aminotransferase
MLNDRSGLPLFFRGVTMDPLATELNNTIRENNPHLFEMLSPFGRRIFFPKGILSQSAEAKQKAHRHNATIGIALEEGKAMHLDCIHDWVGDLDPDDVFPYAPAAGKPALRELWLQKQLRDNPSLRGKRFTKPIVTSALTHGLSLVGDLFVAPNDKVILPDKFWGNYRLLYAVRQEAQIVLYPFYDAQGKFNVGALKTAIEQEAGDGRKRILILNFPNNPCGYSLLKSEAEAVIQLLVDSAAKGIPLLVVLDEAYFGLFYDENLMSESLFGRLINLDERLVVIKLDGATKEDFVWGLRVGFIAYGAHSARDLDAVYQALEKKTMGAIRSTVSNASHLSQTLVLKGMESPEFEGQRQAKLSLLRARAMKVRQVLQNPKYREAWTAYPFNSGYFMCLRLEKLDGETLRRHLLEHYGVGVIATGGRDIRIAFSCIEERDVEELFETIHRGIMDLQSRP